MAEKYVIDGAKVKCTMCSKPEGKLMVTSNTISIQDKFWATEDDKGKPNVIFQGNCLKFSNNPPPCQSVMALSQWQKTAIGVTIDNKAPLLENSLIMCTTGGVPVTIVDTKQKSIPTNLASLAKEGAPVPAVVVTNDPEIIDAYWVDKDEKKTTILSFGENERARIKIETENALGKKITVKIYENDFGPMNEDFIHEYSWTNSKKDMIYSFNVTPAMFIKGEEDLVHFYFTVQIDDEKESEFCNSSSEYLKVHLVQYIPGIMRSLGWKKGASIQDEWFKRVASEDASANNPNTSIISMSWVLKYERAKTIHDIIVNQKRWVNSAGKRALIQEIKRMKDDNIKIPSSEGTTTSFGVFDDRIVNYKNSQIPLFDKYHYQEIAFMENAYSATDEDLDDLYAALANFVFRMSSGGTITRKKDHFLIRITKVATYVRDSFNFIDEGWNNIMSQPLGYWNIKEKKASTSSKKGFRYINNGSYNTYRKEFGKGGDFLVFSNLKYINTNDEFKVPIKTFN